MGDFVVKSHITGKIIKISLQWNKMKCLKCQSWSDTSKKCDHFHECVSENNFCSYFVPNGYKMSKDTIIKMFESISQRFIKEKDYCNYDCGKYCQKLQ